MHGPDQHHTYPLQQIVHPLIIRQIGRHDMLQSPAACARPVTDTRLRRDAA